jgi:hypothetical protein
MDASLRELVVLRSAGRCEYCRISQRYFTELFQIEHIVARQHRGPTVESNLALACARYNRHKGPNLAGLDPLTHELIRLFNPRTDSWSDHFQEDITGEILGTSAIGRTTTYVLDMNSPRRIQLRSAIAAIDEFRFSGL